MSKFTCYSCSSEIHDKRNYLVFWVWASGHQWPVRVHKNNICVNKLRFQMERP